MVYVIFLPCFSETFTFTVCSGRSTSGMVSCGSRTVFLSTTSIGTMPYILIGESFLVEACGCRSEILMYTFGAISPVIGSSTVVSPFLVCAQSVFTTFVPFSIEIKALPPSLDGKNILALSPTA